MKSIFKSDAVTLARELVGYELIYSDVDGARGGIITETEAYTADDEASHSYNGKTDRNYAMFLNPGTIYIYRVYGIHLCLNIVCGNNDGQAVLIREIKPTVGIEYMKEMRKQHNISNLTNGPGKVMQALQIPMSLNGLSIDKNQLSLTRKLKPQIQSLARIGISKNTQALWRYKGILL